MINRCDHLSSHLWGANTECLKRVFEARSDYYYCKVTEARGRKGPAGEYAPSPWRQDCAAKVAFMRWASHSLGGECGEEYGFQPASD